MPATPSSSPWPAGCEGAVSLTFDEGLRSQIETAIPLLDEHGLQATFYLNPPRDGDEDDWRARLAPWRAATERGHEIGNHSLTHPCSQNFDVVGRGREALTFVGRGLVAMTLEEIEQDVREAERRLRAGIPEQTRNRIGLRAGGRVLVRRCGRPRAVTARSRSLELSTFPGVENVALAPS